MSVETLSPKPVEAEAFSARPKVETSRGTEVQSNTGNKIVDMANRVASFFDRMKRGRTEVAETTQEKFDQGKAFLKSTGEKAVAAAVRAGNIIGGVALVGAEFAVGAGVLAGKVAAEKSARLRDTTSRGLETAGNWLADKDAQTGNAIDQGITMTLQKGSEIKDAVAGKYEAIRGFFKDRAETAKLKMEVLRRKWVARYSRTRRGVIGAVESGKAFARETGENAKHNANVIRRTGQMALAHYRANSVPAIPR